jgi:hypothetical protein
MSGIAPTFHKIFQWTDPVGSRIDNGKADLIGDALKPKPAPITPGAPPNVSTAGNLAQEQNDLRNRQRGVLSNIFAGQNAPAPATATGTVLGG